MKLPKKDLKIETMKGTGPGGQRKNKVETACRITHLPTGVSAYADERSQSVSKREAMKELKRRLAARKEELMASKKKARRDLAIHDTKRIRTYDIPKGVVTDHRSGKKATTKEVLDKGRIDLLR